MTFHVGQKVVCIANPTYCNGNKVQPTVGEKYTVRFIEVAHGRESIGLVEVRPGKHRSGHEYSFWASRFRPIVERKTNISIFTAMLTGSKIGADA